MFLKNIFTLEITSLRQIQTYLLYDDYVHYMSEPISKEELREKVSDFLRRNFPQIQMHGGSSSVTSVNEETGEVTIRLGGACSGCGISPMTTQHIQRRLPKKIEEVTSVSVDTGTSSSGTQINMSTPSQKPDDSEEEREFDAPF